MLIDADWCWLMLLDADWCTNKVNKVFFCQCVPPEFLRSFFIYLFKLIYIFYVLSLINIETPPAFVSITFTFCLFIWFVLTNFSLINMRSHLHLWEELHRAPWRERATRWNHYLDYHDYQIIILVQLGEISSQLSSNYHRNYLQSNYYQIIILVQLAAIIISMKPS